MPLSGGYVNGVAAKRRAGPTGPCSQGCRTAQALRDKVRHVFGANQSRIGHVVSTPIGGVVEERRRRIWRRRAIVRERAASWRAKCQKPPPDSGGRAGEPRCSTRCRQGSLSSGSPQVLPPHVCAVRVAAVRSTGRFAKEVVATCGVRGGGGSTLPHQGRLCRPASRPQGFGGIVGSASRRRVPPLAGPDDFPQPVGDTAPAT